jgi:hypothetical protein
MDYRIVVPPEISRAIRGFGLDRELLLQLLFALRSEIEEGRVDAYRHQQDRRDPDDPDRNFWFELVTPDDGQSRSFRFVVDDATAPGVMIVVEAREV